MADFDWNRVQRGKDLHRTQLAALPPAEKVRIVERLRDQGLAMRNGAAIGPRNPAANLHVVDANATNASAASANTASSVGHILLSFFGANATLASAITANATSTLAVMNQQDRNR